MTALRHFIPSKALQQRAAALANPAVITGMKKIDAMMHGRKFNAVSASQANFLRMLGDMQPARDEGELEAIASLIREVADCNISQLQRRSVTPGMKGSLEGAREWCLKMKAKYDAMSDVIDDRATEMTAHIGEQPLQKRQQVASQIQFLDEALGYLTQVNEFATTLLQEIENQSHVSRLQNTPPKNPGGKPLAG